MTDFPSYPGSAEEALVAKWRAEAKRHESVAQEPGMDAQEYTLHDEAHRVYTKCADDLASTLGVAQTRQLPEIPDDDADFTPDLARKIIAKYQQLLAAQGKPDCGASDEMVERAWAAIVGADVAPICFQAGIIRADLKVGIEAALSIPSTNCGGGK